MEAKAQQDIESGELARLVVESRGANLASADDKVSIEIVVLNRFNFNQISIFQKSVRYPFLFNFSISS